jgi:hypothetical protein
MVRLVLCGVRECRQALIDRDREKDREITNEKKRKKNSITEHVLASHRGSFSSSIALPCSRSFFSCFSSSSLRAYAVRSREDIFLNLRSKSCFALILSLSSFSSCFCFICSTVHPSKIDTNREYVCTPGWRRWCSCMLCSSTNRANSASDLFSLRIKKASTRNSCISCIGRPCTCSVVMY